MIEDHFPRTSVQEELRERRPLTTDSRIFRLDVPPRERGLDLIPGGLRGESEIGERLTVLLSTFLASDGGRAVF